MVVGAFPIAKLGLMAIKHIAKPISSLLKRTAQKNPAFKKLVVAPPARLYNTISVRSKMWMLGLGQPRFIPPLNDAMTITMGGDLLGEMCIFLIGALLIVGEYSRQSRNERLKQEKRQFEREELERKVNELTDRVTSQTKEISQLKTMVGYSDSFGTMVIGSFPLGKVFVYGMKQISKPVGHLLTWAGKHNPHVRRYVIIPPAQLYNIFEVRWKLRMLRLKQPKRVPPLTPPIATKLGSDLLSETIVVVIGLGLIYHEISRQKLKKQKKQLEQMEQRRVLAERLDYIRVEVEQQERDIYSLKAALHGYRR